MAPIQRFLLAAVVAAAPSTALAAGKIPEGMSYTRPLPGGLVFVMFGDPAAEAKSSAGSQAEFRELRQKYPQAGLYRGDSPSLVWPLDGPFAPPDAVFLTADGRHLVRLDGEWWREKDFPGRNRLPTDVEQAQLDAPALSFFDDGKLVRRYTLREVVADPGRLPHSPHYVLWVAGPALNEDTGRFVLPTQDSMRQVYDVATGELLARQAVGLDNPMTTPIIAGVAVLMAAVLGVWAWFVFVRWKRPVGSPEAPAAGPRVTSPRSPS